MTAVIFYCKLCKRFTAVAKYDCTFHRPEEEPWVLERAHIDPDCDIEQVQAIMKS